MQVSNLLLRKKKIESFSTAAQKFPQNTRWVFSDAFLFEKAGSQLETLPFYMVFLNWLLLSPLLLKLVSAISLVPVLLSVIILKWRFDWRFKSKKNRTEKYCNRIFVGFGAAAEEPMLAWYRDQANDAVAYIDSASSLAKWHHVPFFRLISRTKNNLIKGNSALKNLPEELKCLRALLHFSIVKHVALYSYWDVWYSELNSAAVDIDEIVAIHSGLSTFAAVDNNFKVNFLAHGLIRHSIVFPDFHRVELMTEPEILHVKNRFKNGVNISLQAYRSAGKNSVLKSRIILFIAADGSEQELDLFMRFASRFSSFQIKMYLRPRNNGSGNKLVHGEYFSNIKVLCSDGSLLDLLTEIKPKIVVSTASAGLIEAKHIGCIPVTLASANDRVIIDMVFPMLDEFLNWPRDDSEVSCALLNLSKLS